MSNVTLPKDSTPTEGSITKVEDGVAIGLSRTKYLGRKSNFGNRQAAEKIASGDVKFDMYANALPKAIRQKVIEMDLDVRAVYGEYRKIGKDALVAKYS